jgi:hypothetical protein
MREILFRGKTADGVWVYGCYTRYSNYEGYITEDLIENKVYSVFTKTVGQYIGKMDKNGKRMFEGDKLKVPSFIYPLAIVFGEDELAFEMKCLETGIIYSLNYTGKEVIGNIHESEVQK